MLAGVATMMVAVRLALTPTAETAGWPNEPPGSDSMIHRIMSATAFWIFLPETALFRRMSGAMRSIPSLFVALPVLAVRV